MQTPCGQINKQSFKCHVYKSNQLITNPSVPHKTDTSMYLHKGLCWKRPCSFAVIAQSRKQAQSPSTGPSDSRPSEGQLVNSAFPLMKRIPEVPLSSCCFILDCSSRNTFKLRLPSASWNLLFTCSRTLFSPGAAALISRSLMWAFLVATVPLSNVFNIWIR